ncbi:MAG: AsmA family protein [Burkholderiaceae bacterium]
MGKVIRWFLVAAAVLLVLAAAAAFALHRWVGSDDFRSRVEQEAAVQLGLPVKLGRIDVSVFPVPAVAVEDIAIQARPPVTLERVEARPVWTALAAGRLEVATLVVKGATLPQQGIDAIIAAVQKKNAQPGAPAKAASAPPAEGAAAAVALIPRRTVLDGVTWISARGMSLTMDAQARLDADGLPGEVHYKIVKGAYEGTDAHLEREGEGWRLDAKVGGGTVKGLVTLKRAKPGAKGGPGDFLVEGQLATRGVEVSALTAPTKTLTGRLDADTALHAQFREPGAIADVARTQTTFTVKDATIHGLDLLKAVSTIGLSRGGTTQLDTLAGQVATQGRAVQLTNLVASSGRLAASGHVAISPSKALSGRINVDAGTKLVGIPLEVGGTLDAPQVGLSRGALVGAALGSALAPGAGTAAGASVGDKLGSKLRGLFGK